MIRAVFRRAAVALWVAQAGLVLAAQDVITPEAIPLMQWGYTLVLSLAGGAAASFTRYAGGASTDKWKLELARDFICSTLAGVIALFGALQFQVPPLLGAIAIALSGWGGSRFLEWAYLRWQLRAQALVDPADRGRAGP
jgi:hypothetical protein